MGPDSLSLTRVLASLPISRSTAEPTRWRRPVASQPASSPSSPSQLEERSLSSTRIIPPATLERLFPPCQVPKPRGRKKPKVFHACSSPPAGPWRSTETIRLASRPIFISRPRFSRHPLGSLGLSLLEHWKIPCFVLCPYLVLNGA